MLLDKSMVIFCVGNTAGKIYEFVPHTMYNLTQPKIEYDNNI
jgi:hypothetical protein